MTDTRFVILALIALALHEALKDKTGAIVQWLLGKLGGGIGALLTKAGQAVTPTEPPKA